MKYCGDCKFYKTHLSLRRRLEGYSPLVENCVCEENKKVEYSYLGPKVVYIKSPKDINHDNCCPWHKRKGLWDKICS